MLQLWFAVCDLWVVVCCLRCVDLGMPVEERCGGWAEKGANMDAGSMQLGELRGVNGAVVAAGADGRMAWLLMRPVVDHVCGE